MKIKAAMQGVIFTLLLVTLGATAHAQATRTWVSGVGDDANPCSRTAPCKTFAGAISKTAAGGEIDALDPGGFGTLTITKAITIDGGGGQVASVLASGTVGFNVNAGASDVVILRNLTINGTSQSAFPGTDAIRYNSGMALVVENCNLINFSTTGINVNNLTAGGNLSVQKTTITNTGIGVHVTGSGPIVFSSLRDVSIKGCAQAIDTNFGVLDVSSSLITQNSAFGLHAEHGSITSIGCVLTGNGVGVQTEANALIRLSKAEIYNNPIAFGGTGTVFSAGNNQKNGPAPATVPLTTF